MYKNHITQGIGVSTDLGVSGPLAVFFVDIKG